MKALSIRQPWAGLIVNGHKDIENRSWPTRFRGEFLVHASKGMTRAEYENVDLMLALDEQLQHIKLPAFEQLERGGIVGVATIADCITRSKSPWFFGSHGFVLAGAKPVPFAPLKGMLGFFDVPTGAVTP